jgi:hypothetical protein
LKNLVSRYRERNKKIFDFFDFSFWLPAGLIDFPTALGFIILEYKIEIEGLVEIIHEWWA